ncbi:MAG: hypothetical protein LBE25_08665 [Arthrobacter sp.]|jgi:hypothetical protein|nr:hypothetical protein [Arthrobacter sp.]
MAVTDLIQAQDPKPILHFLMRAMDLYGRLRNGSHTARRTAATLRQRLTIEVCAFKLD